MFIFDAGNHLLEREPPESLAGRPVADRQASVIAGDQAPGNQEEKRQNGNKNGETMVGGVVAGGGQISSLNSLFYHPGAWASFGGIAACASHLRAQELISKARTPAPA
jgi:hypothetical protein